MNVRASHVRPGDTITGIWSTARDRFDQCLFTAHRVHLETTPQGVAIVTYGTGPYAWQTATYCADTVVRIREDRS